MIKRTGRVSNDRATSGLSSRLGDVLQRRRGAKMEAEDAQSRNVMTGGIVTMPPEATPLSDLLQKARIFSRPARSTEFLHVSDLVGKCIRKIALAERLKLPPKPQALRLTDLLTFAQGDAIHDVLRSRAAAGGPRAVWGNWECKCGTTSTATPQLFSDVDPERRCPACKGPLNVYKEVPMLVKDLGIVGNPDLILFLSEFDALHITELKSIAHDAWKELVRPLPDHVIQVLFYWYLMRRLGYSLTDKVSILYATKGWIFSGDAFKEFVVDCPSQVHRLDPYLEDAKAVLAARAGGDLPPRTCASEQSPDAKKCELCRSCFGVNNDEQPITISIAQALGSRPRIRTRTPSARG